MVRRFCGQCGATRSSARARFCIHCGHPLASEATSGPSRRWVWWVGGLGLALIGFVWLNAGSFNPRLFADLPAPTHVRPSHTAPQTATNAPQAIGMLEVHVVDVGQGDGILIQSPAGTTVVIDGGYPDSGMLAYLQQHDITHIDALIASHPHADHIGAQIAILETLSVAGVWTSGASHTTDTYEMWLDAILNRQVPYHEVSTNDRIRVGDLDFLVLRSDPNAGDLNDTSVVLKLGYGTWSMLFTGDAEAASEQALLNTAAAALPATVLKVGHHGSATSSGSDFVAAISPSFAIYSAGHDNSYGHPHPSVITTLCGSGAQVYGTDVGGSIVIATDGTETTIQAQHALASACQGR